MDISMKHLDESDLLLYYYRDGGRVAESDKHLASCADCRRRFEELSVLLDAIVPRPVRTRSEDYGTEVWNRIRASLFEAKPRRAWFAPSCWAAAVAIAALVIVAFVQGKHSRLPQAPARTAEVSRPELRNKVLLVAVGNLLDRAQVLLVEFAHVSGSGEIDISQEQQGAADLVATNRLYRQTAREVGDADIANTLDELERLLLEIGHQPDKITAAELKQIQNRVRSQGILFKIRVIRAKVHKESIPRSEPKTLREQTS